MIPTDEGHACPAPSLTDLMALDERGFRLRFAGTAVLRTGRTRLLRSVAVALGNWGHPDALHALLRGLHDPEPQIRGHSAWALGRFSEDRPRMALQAALEMEQDSYARDEIVAALAQQPGVLSPNHHSM